MERTLSQLALWLQDRLLIAYIVNVESLVAHVRTIAGDMPAKAIIDEAKARKWLAGPLQSYGANLRGEGEFSQPFYRILPAVADRIEDPQVHQDNPLPTEQAETDGPIPPNGFHYRGGSVKLTPVLWAILNEMWGREAVAVSDLEKIWDEKDVPPQNIAPTLTRVNARLREVGYPKRLSKTGRYVSWVSR